MLNDRDDDKYEAPEETEYHFSDEDVSYEVEPETPKATVPATESTETIFQRLSRSKRMIISLVVFLVLVFVVYKMVTPTTTTRPATDIRPVQPVTAQTPMSATVPSPTQTTSPPLEPAPIQSTPPPPIPSTPTPAQPAIASAPPPLLTQPTPPPLTAQAQPAMTPSPPPPAVPAPPAITTPPPASPATAPSAPAVATPPPITSQPPASIPASASTYLPSGASPTPSLNAQVPGGIEASVAALAANNEKLIAQLQADYTQRLNDFAAQNKGMQSELKTLSNRVATMETELTKLLQILTKQTQQTGPVIASPQFQATEPRIAYNVQAIIPGRAWLRSDSGETVTVAEGDMIKNVGRVVKIDPYDGVVQINTGNKVVSLSYGNGG